MRIVQFEEKTNSMRIRFYIDCIYLYIYRQQILVILQFGQTLLLFSSVPWPNARVFVLRLKLAGSLKSFSF
jgi:hypothetical protein